MEAEVAEIINRVTPLEKLLNSQFENNRFKFSKNDYNPICSCSMRTLSVVLRLKTTHNRVKNTVKLGVIGY